MQASKWGETINDTQLFGDHSITKIAIGQFVTIVIVLILIQPFFVCYSNELRKERISVIYTILIASLIVALTYMLPLIKLN